MTDVSQIGLRRFALAAGVAFAALGGTAIAAGLPGASSSTATAVLSKLGVNPPGPNSHAGTHPDGSAPAAAADPASTAADADADALDGHGKGAQISTLARTTTATGVAKGAEISTAASGGKSQAGQHGKAAEDHGKAGDEHGKAGEDHGNAGEPHGQSGDSHGQSGSHRP